MNEKSRDTCNIGNTTLKEDIKSKDKNNENTTQKTEDQRSLQKPWKNLMMNNVDHYKNLG
jgi:hypothetical protein